MPALSTRAPTGKQGIRVPRTHTHTTIHHHHPPPHARMRTRMPPRPRVALTRGRSRKQGSSESSRRQGLDQNIQAWLMDPVLSTTWPTLLTSARPISRHCRPPLLAARAPRPRAAQLTALSRARAVLSQSARRTRTMAPVRRSLRREPSGRGRGRRHDPGGSNAPLGAASCARHEGMGGAHGPCCGADAR